MSAASVTWASLRRKKASSYSVGGRESSEDASDLLHNAQYGLSLLADLPRYFQSAGIEAQDRILGSIFPANLVFEEVAYRTPEVADSIRLLRGK